MYNRAQFIELAGSIDRNGIPDLLAWLETTDFYTAPASTRYHGSYIGGLCEHSLNVYRELTRLRGAFPEVKVSDDSAKLVSLFHDLCKVNFYTTEKRNRKNEYGHWETYDSYTVKEQFCFGGHGSKSVFLIQRFVPLTDEEAAAINSHMGAFDNERVGDVYQQFHLAWALHVADEASTYLIESKS